tara:strand:- start:303 stop:440 length:138 start_codon:yes stop_codon:yes gene_type:complete
MEQYRNAKHTFSAQRLGRQAQGMRRFTLSKTRPPFSGLHCAGVTY